MGEKWLVFEIDGDPSTVPETCLNVYAENFLGAHRFCVDRAFDRLRQVHPDLAAGGKHHGISASSEEARQYKKVLDRGPSEKETGFFLLYDLPGTHPHPHSSIRLIKNVASTWISRAYQRTLYCVRVVPIRPLIIPSSSKLVMSDSATIPIPTGAVVVVETETKGSVKEVIKSSVQRRSSVRIGTDRHSSLLREIEGVSGFAVPSERRKLLLRSETQPLPTTAIKEALAKPVAKPTSSVGVDGEPQT